MTRKIDYPIIINYNKSDKGTYEVNFADSVGTYCKNCDEKEAISEARESFERIAQKEHRIPTPSDLSYIARENPTKTIRLVKVTFN